jgi:hypothetical protein
VADAGAYIDDASAFTHVFDGGLGNQNHPKNIDVEMPMELLLGDRFERGKSEFAGVVHKNVDPSVVLNGCRNDALRFRGL